MEENTTPEKPLILEGIVQRSAEIANTSKRIYPSPGEPLIVSQEFADKLKDALPTEVTHATSLDPSKSLVDSVKDAAQTELTVEEQKAIFKQIMAESKQKSASRFLTKPKKMISPNADKKKKAKSKMQKNSRKTNRKKK